jgi:hypothetical protein
MADGQHVDPRFKLPSRVPSIHSAKLTDDLALAALTEPSRGPPTNLRKTSGLPHASPHHSTTANKAVPTAAQTGGHHAVPSLASVKTSEDLAAAAVTAATADQAH